MLRKNNKEKLNLNGRSKIRICVIIDYWFPYFGGGINVAWETSRKLVEKYGYDVHIFTRKLKNNEGVSICQNEEYFNGKMKIIRCGPCTTDRNFFGRFFSLSVMIIKVLWYHNALYKYDILHGHSKLGALPLKIISLFCGAKTVFTIHGICYLNSKKKNIYTLLERLFFLKWKYDCVISVGEEYLKFSNSNRNKNIKIIKGGCSFFDYQFSVSRNENVFKAIFVGRLNWVKDLPNLIKAIMLLKENDSELVCKNNFKLFIVGAGEEELKCRQLVDEYFLNNIVVFCGKLDGYNLIREYKTSNLLILPSISEGDPLVIKEAWSAGLPVLSTRSGGPEYCVKDGYTGFLVDKQDPVLLMKKIVSILKMSHDDLVAIGERGRELVRNNYTWDIVTLNIKKCYMELLNK